MYYGLHYVHRINIMCGLKVFLPNQFTFKLRNE